MQHTVSILSFSGAVPHPGIFDVAWRVLFFEVPEGAPQRRESDLYIKLIRYSHTTHIYTMIEIYTYTTIQNQQ